MIVDVTAVVFPVSPALMFVLPARVELPETFSVSVRASPKLAVPLAVMFLAETLPVTVVAPVTVSLSLAASPMVELPEAVNVPLTVSFLATVTAPVALTGAEKFAVPFTVSVSLPALPIVVVPVSVLLPVTLSVLSILDAPANVVFALTCSLSLAASPIVFALPFMVKAPLSVRDVTVVAPRVEVPALSFVVEAVPETVEFPPTVSLPLITSAKPV